MEEEENKSKADSVYKIVKTVEDKLLKSKKKVKKLEVQLEEKEKEIIKLTGEKEMLRFKTVFLERIISANTNLVFSDIYKEGSDGIHLYNYENGNVPVILHDYTNEDDPEKILRLEVKKKRKSPKKVKKEENDRLDEKGEESDTEKVVKQKYRCIKKDIEDTPEKDEEKVRRGEERIKKMLVGKVDENMTEYIKNTFLEMEKCKAIKKSLYLSIRVGRSKLMATMSLEEYTTMILSDIKKLEEILKRKKCDQKKISESVTLMLSPLDQRLVYYGRYYDAVLDTEEVQLYQIVLTCVTKFGKRVIPFSMEEINRRIHNYGIAICSLTKFLELVFVSPYEMNNLVYVRGKDKGKVEDPYSFYIFEKAEGGKRFWTMECRLYNFSEILGEKLRKYCIMLFRRIYRDIFSDNIYRENYTQKAVICQADCCQLVNNIIRLSKPKEFCNIMRDIISTNCVLNPKDMDKFNFIADDKMVKKAYNELEDSDEFTDKCISELFDDLDPKFIDKIKMENVH